MIIQNQNENTHYFVKSEKFLNYKGNYYIIIENSKTGENKTVQVCPYVGITRILIKENVLKGLENSHKFIFGRILADVILIEDKNFYKIDIKTPT